MSSINTGIIASVSQGALQQSQVARVSDAVDNDDAKKAKKLRKKQEAHTESVEDSYETTDEHLRIKEDEHAHQEAKDQDENDSSDYEHVDLQA